MKTVPYVPRHPLADEPARSFSAPANHGTSSQVTSAVRRLKYPFSGGWLVMAVALGDFLISALALCLAWWLSFHTGLSRVGFPEPMAGSLATYSGHIVLGAILMSVGLVAQRAYSYQSLLNAAHEIRAVIMAIGAWLATYLSLSLLLRFQPTVSRLFCLLAPSCLFILLSYWRLIVAHYLAPKHLTQSVRRRIMLLGWNDEFRRLAEFTAASKNPEVELCGILVSSGGLPGPAPLPRGIEVVGTYDDLPALIERSLCDGVLVGDLELGNAELSSIAALCEREMVDFELVPTCFPALRSGLSLRHIGDVPVLGLGSLPLHSTFNLHLKRSLDIVGALIGLLLSAPLIAFFGILISRESPGPVFYRQRRIGVNGTAFDMLKLRSMHLNAEADSRPGWTVKDDPRRLRIGKLMRSWNIDELPQFLNVLKGEMSLVGPRPERPEFISDFKHVIPHYNLRHSVKPGITGWAQVHGFRGDTDLVERVRHDLYYIEHWNLCLDLQILLMTLFKPNGGY